MGARRGILGAVVAFALVFVAVPASAQLWNGAPSGQALGIGVSAGFPDGYDIYGAEVFRGLGQLEVGAEYTLLNLDPDSYHAFGANVGYSALQAANGLVTAGPVAGLTYTSLDGGNIVEVPVGLALLANVPAASGITVRPYAIPALVWVRSSPDAGDSTSDTEFGFRVGANVGVENLVFGGAFDKVGDGDGVFSVNIAYLIGNR